MKASINNPSYNNTTMKKVNDKITDLLAIGCLQPDDPKFHMFKQTIVPAVVNEFILPSGLNSHSYKCPFETCGVLVSRSNILERHLREKHYDDIPIGVFGFKNIYRCIPCGQTFKRQEHLSTHYEGRKHLKNVISQGVATFDQVQKWNDICKAKKELRTISSNELNYRLELINEQTDESTLSSESSYYSVLLDSTPSSSYLTSCSSTSLVNFPSFSSLNDITSTPNNDKFQLDMNVQTFSNKTETFGPISMTSEQNEDLLFNSFTFINLLNSLENNHEKNQNNVIVEQDDKNCILRQNNKRKYDKIVDDSELIFDNLEYVLSTKRNKADYLADEEEQKAYFQL